MKNKIILNNKEPLESIQTPLRLLIVIILSIIVSDTLVWVFIKFIPPLTTLSEMLLDSILISVLLFPIVYLFAFRPLTAAIIKIKKADEEIQLKNEVLKTINVEKDKFFSIIAHDLKGPLGAFLGATQILTEEIQNMNLDEIKEISVNMQESASSIYGLLENLLEWSRLNRGLMDFSPAKIYLKQETISCIEVLTESARKKNININYTLPDDLTICSDLHMFKTIVRNLVSNAIKFTPKYGEINVSATAIPDSIVEVKICDTGIGMNRQMINKLFLLNEKTNRAGTEGEPSTGLGLLLCKEFVEKNGGKIWVDSEEGNGSTFSFTIPVNSEV
jgi:signal transduction histidine kinase